MSSILISWIGKADLDGVSTPDEPGPLLRIIQNEPFDEVHLLCNQPPEAVEPLRRQVDQLLDDTVELHRADLRSPIHFADIYHALDTLLSGLAKTHKSPTFTIQLTSGTPAMSAVSILVGKTKYAARFLQASREAGVQEEDIPFDIAADFLPAITGKEDKKLADLFASLAPDTAAFDDILTQNPLMQTLKHKAAILAQRNVPVLIYGETGTGKELFAKAIHNASARADKPMLVLNCGAIPKDLIDATLFGYTKGAFTGAVTPSSGYFEEANGGTLFLDEFGELTLGSQVRLLRVLQDGSFTPVGSTKPKKVDVRIIAATNKDLVDEVAAGRFREDLFYRVAIGVLQLPPLRERSGDLVLLADTLLSKIQNEVKEAGLEKGKKLSVKAKKVIQSYPWPGNVRELHATLLRATLWHSGDRLNDEDIRNALVSVTPSKDALLGRDISQGIDINDVISEACTHYIGRALKESGGNKSKAADLLGLKNYQTLSNWMEKYGIE